MELQFHKKELACLRQVKREVQDQEQTLEVRLEDSMPDIGRVLGAWGQVLLRGKEWHSGSMNLSGGVMVWILYAPEQDGQSQKIEAWLPFQMKWELPHTQRDGKICASCLLRNVDARSISARKLMVRCNVSVLAQALMPDSVDLYTPGELPEDVQIHKNDYRMCFPRETGEKHFYIEDTLTIPANAPAMERLIRWELRPELVDQKVMADKVVFRGSGLVHILYVGQDGQLYSWDGEVPFSQYAELDNTYEQEATARILPELTSLELEKMEDGRLQLKAGLTGQYVIYDQQMLELVEDAYSPVREVVPQMEQLELPVVLDSSSQTFHGEVTIPLEGIRPVDVSFLPEYPDQMRNDAGVELKMNGQFQMLYYDAEGKLDSTDPRWSESWTLSAAQGTAVEPMAAVSGITQAAFSGGNANLRADILVDAVTTSRQGFPMVTGLELADQREHMEKRPSLILRKAGEDDLWQIAKDSGSTVEQIQMANNLTEAPMADQMLLIPIIRD